MKLPKGFLASGVRAGIRKKRPDLGLIVAADGANAAAVFTKNPFQAAPVVLVEAGAEEERRPREGGRRQRRLRERRHRAARDGRGEARADARRGAAAVRRGARSSSPRPASSASCCPTRKSRDSLPDAITRLSAGGIDAFSHAILTTDVGPKLAQASFTIGGKRGRIVGVAKGAGMIHPNMATMLGFVMTDAAVDAGDAAARAEDRGRPELQRDLRRRRHLDERHGARSRLGKARQRRTRRPSPTSSAR